MVGARRHHRASRTGGGRAPGAARGRSRVCPRPRARRAGPGVRRRRSRSRRAPVAWRAMTVDRVLLAAPRGFCAGVEMAIKALAWMVRAFDPPVYCYHEIVHNQLVVERFERLGVVFVDDVSEVPPGKPIMLSAHGSAPEVWQAARANAGLPVDTLV